MIPKQIRIDACSGYGDVVAPILIMLLPLQDVVPVMTWAQLHILLAYRHMHAILSTQFVYTVYPAGQ